MRRSLLAFTPTLALALAACGDDVSGPRDSGTVIPDSGVAPKPDAGVGPTACDNPPLTPSTSACTVSRTGGPVVLFKGNVLAENGVLENGQLLVGADGTILCAACKCEDTVTLGGDNAVVECPDALITPGLINTHEHLTFGEGAPVPHGTERFEHRHDWREGQNGHTELDTPSSSQGAGPVIYAELRHVFGGATAIVGAGGETGFLRNLDRRPELQEGLDQAEVENSSFPLDDVRGLRRDSDCNYGSGRDMPDDIQVVESIAYVPHIAEGIGDDARNEFICTSRDTDGAADLLLPKTAIVHGVGLLAPDYAAMAAEGASLIWSPRTNIDLYGHTAMVTTAATLGVNVALGTDWPASGSMNLVRELQCASQYNSEHLNGFFTDMDLIDMVTKNAARAVKSDSKIGILAPGLEADITIFHKKGRSGLAAIFDASPADVALVMRGGEPLMGDDALVRGIQASASGCEPLDVCGVMKSVCVMRETGMSLQAVESSVANGTIDLFYCGDPPGEPTCVPSRPGEFTGIDTPGSDDDGDGIPNSEDNCPDVFNAIRPVDHDAQADSDQDMIGDACDPCPLTAFSDTCAAPDPNDRDSDSVPNMSDNCPDDPNPMQEDGDMDGRGDICDRCPESPNPNDGPCPATIYDVKQKLARGKIQVFGALVTAVSTDGYFAQVDPTDSSWDPVLGADYSGVYVFDRGGTLPNRGDQVDIIGDVTEFRGQMQITLLDGGSTTVLSVQNMLPQPVVSASQDLSTTGNKAESLEGVLVEVQNVTVSSSNPDDPNDYGEFEVDGSLRVDDLFFAIDPRPAVGEGFGAIQGILRFANGDTKLEPRDENDVSFGGEPTLIGFDPSSALVSPNTSSSPMDIVLSRVAMQDVTITLTSSAPATVGVPATVVVPSGSDRAPVAITAGSPSPNPITVTASLGGQSVSAMVTVVDPARTPAIVAVFLNQTTISPNGSTNGSVMLDLPGEVGGTQVTLDVTPAGIATVPATVTVAEGQIDAPFTLNAGANLGMGVLTGSAGGQTRQVSFSISQSTTRPPGPGELVITEIHFNPSVSTNEHLQEWFEIHNPTADTLTLDGLDFADGFTFHVFSTSAVIAPGAHEVIAYSPDPAMNGGIMPIATYGEDNIRLNNGGDQLVLTYGGQEIDRVEYTSSFGGGNGQAICLRAPYPMDNDVASAWGESVGTFGTSADAATPGVASDATNCP